MRVKTPEDEYIWPPAIEKRFYRALRGFFCHVKVGRGSSMRGRKRAVGAAMRLNLEAKLKRDGDMPPESGLSNP